MEINFIKGDQLRVNDKWFFDVTQVEDNQITVRIKYKLSATNNTLVSKEFTLPNTIFLIKSKDNNTNVIYVNIDDKNLNKYFGSFKNFLYREEDIYKLFEDSSYVSGGSVDGMGALVSPSAETGGFGSGDIQQVVGFHTQLSPIATLGLNAFNKKPIKIKKSKSKSTSTSTSKKKLIGLEDLTNNKELIKKFLVSDKESKKSEIKLGNGVIKRPSLSIYYNNLSEAIDDSNLYYQKVFEFLDYPYSDDIDVKLVEAINKERDKFLKVSVDRLKNYLEIFYNSNKSIIEKSSEFKNKIKELI